MNHRKRPFVRMHEGGAFGGILETAVRSLPGCIAIAFIDQEGEAVDAVGWADEFEIKVTGAHLCVMMDIARFSKGGDTRELLIAATKLSYRVRAMTEGYALVMLFARDAAFIASHRVIDACIYALSREAGFPGLTKPAWFSVEVAAHGPPLMKPRRVRSHGPWYEVDVLGAVMGLPHRERAYRVRVANGNEVTLLREPFGGWWSDNPIE